METFAFDSRMVDVPRLMLNAGRLLDVPIIVASTACLYFHRFFQRESLETHDCYHVAQACLFLASKVEESGRHVRDVINVVYRLRYPQKRPLQVNDTYWKLKENVVHMEQIVLRVLNYNLTVKHAHTYLLHIVRSLEGTAELASVAFYIVNDSLCTNVSLHYDPHVIACAAVYLGAELISEELGSDHGIEWYSKFDVTRVQIERVCCMLLDMYVAFKHNAEKTKRGSNEKKSTSSSSATVLNVSQTISKLSPTLTFVSGGMVPPTGFSLTTRSTTSSSSSSDSKALIHPDYEQRAR